MDTRVAWFCSLGLGCLFHAAPLSAQSSGITPGAPPLSTLPQSASPTPQTSGPADLQLSRQLHPQQQAQMQVAVRQLAIAGVNALPFEEIASIFQPLAGQTVTLEQLAQAAGQATTKYKEAGYPLSFVYLPEQSFQNGIVQVVAVEGYASEVQLIGDAGKSVDLLQAMARPLMEEKPLRQSTFERQTMLIASMENLKVAASASMPNNPAGAVPLQLRIDRTPIAFNVTAELRQGDPKGIANLTLNDPLWGGSQLQVSALLDNPEKERFISASVRQWLNPQGTQMRLSLLDFKGNDNFAQGWINDISTQRRVEVNVTHPLVLSSTKTSIVGGSLYGSNYAKRYEFPTLGLVVQDREEVRALQLTWNGFVQINRTQHQGNASFTQGIDSLGAGNTRSSNLGALPPGEAKFDFSRIAADYSLRHRLAGGLGFAAGIGGQYSPHHLPVTERISFGGSRYGRGYRGGEAAGDRGLGYSLEASYLFPIKNTKWLTSVEPYVLYEQAKTWFESSSFVGQELKSSSAGIRLSDGRHYAVDLSISKPQGDPSAVNPERKVRYSLSLSYQLNP